MSQIPDHAHDLFSLQTGLAVAITHYSQRPARELAGQIATQLDAILSHPQIELFPDERRVFSRMRTLWGLRAAPPATHGGKVVAFAAR